MTDEENEDIPFGLDFENGFYFYLNKVGLDPNIISKTQFNEMRKVYMAGVGNTLLNIIPVFRSMDDVEDALEVLENSLLVVRGFWATEEIKNNIKKNGK